MAANSETRSPSIAEKLRFLSAPAAYADAPARVEVVETHMSYVFLAGERAYKLKKPVRYPFLDFSTLEARAHNCREELRLNRRLSANVYLRVVPITADEKGFAIDGSGAAVDWLVEMRRLPHELMLDHIMAMNGVSDAQLAAVCDALAAFYRRADPSSITAKDYLARFFREQGLNRDILARRDFALDHGRASDLLDALDARLAVDRDLLEGRVRKGCVVDGHGDLRPEHICLTSPISIFDCLEFNAELRQVDPFDEIAYLGVECAQLGAPELFRKLVEAMARRLSCAPPWRLVALYAAWRAMLRARLSVAHLLDPSPREPAKWEPLASRYLDLAQRALALDI
jgi:uncharacterized protein